MERIFIINIVIKILTDQKRKQMERSIFKDQSYEGYYDLPYDVDYFVNPYQANFQMDRISQRLREDIIKQNKNHIEIIHNKYKIQKLIINLILYSISVLFRTLIRINYQFRIYMMNNQIIIKLMDSRQSKVIEKIEKAGLLEKHNQLITQGCTNPWLNYRLLKEYDGNLDQVVVVYNEHKKRKEEQNAKAIKILETMGWLNKHQELVEKGFDKVKKNLKALLRTEGDVAKSIEKLSNKKALETDQPIEQIIEQHGFKVQYEKLKEMGYDNEKRIVRLLLKFNGNLEQIIEKLLSGKQGKNRQCKKREGKCQKDKASQEFQEFKQKKKEFKKKLQQLEQSGIHRHKAVKLLAIWNGDADAVIKWFNQVQPQTKVEAQTLQEQQVLAKE
ncbi:unnamed protein product [Paramecium sonneborni]|uniref:UBA domain-containing protein n=1 Tax=Paramecium sonneborni TaxID=65129 RepID=A0A8S1QYN8_9CILI|nr:unnamed protein product [Paramecium sonneborni]